MKKLLILVVMIALTTGMLFAGAQGEADSDGYKVGYVCNNFKRTHSRPMSWLPLKTTFADKDDVTLTLQDAQEDVIRQQDP